MLRTHAGVGLIGQYDRAVGLSPFERFYLGGVLSGFVLDGREIINLRGFDDLSLTMPNQNTGAPVIAKYGAELRYPLSTNPSATIYTLAFIDAGKTWADAREFNPFEVYRSAGVGMRFSCPCSALGLGLRMAFGRCADPTEHVAGTIPFQYGHEHGRFVLKIR